MRMKIMVYTITGRRNHTAVLAPKETLNNIVTAGMRRKKASPVENEQFLTKKALSEIRISGMSNRAILRRRAKKTKEVRSLFETICCSANFRRNNPIVRRPEGRPPTIPMTAENSYPR